MRLLPIITLLSAVAITAAAHADAFNFSAVSSSGGSSGSGTLTATSEGSGEYLITAISGTGVTGLIAPNGFNGNDNLLFLSAAPTFDSHGFSFTDVNRPDLFDVNIFNNGSGYSAFLADEDSFTQTVPVAFALSASLLNLRLFRYSTRAFSAQLEPHVVSLFPGRKEDYSEQLSHLLGGGFCCLNVDDWPFGFAY